jgi:protein tyrosine phosphatase (PTP) superfamily phosphohydrolase (DUF442 family)
MVISPITDQLYVSSMPRTEDAARILNLNIRLILNMHFQIPGQIFSRPPFRLVTLRTYDLFFLPIPMSKLLIGVKLALHAMKRGESILVYCHKGRHRSVAMAACILIACGKTADEAMRLIVKKRPVADPYAWHIQRRIRMFETIWKNKFQLTDIQAI